MTYSEVELRTKEIYIEQHKNFTKDETIFNRFLQVAMDPATYDLPADWFKGKSVLDVGCGNTGYIQVAMHRLGAKSITCVDIGDDWIPELVKVTTRFKVPRTQINCISGSILDLPLQDNSFDFVINNGVIMHLETVEMASKAIEELVRVTARGGNMYIYSGVDRPGIMDQYILPALRQAYAENPEFRDFVDTIDPADVASQINECFKTASEKDPRILPSLGPLLASLFTLDSATFTQNALQVPVQQGPKLSEDWARERLQWLGMQDIRRVPERYWLRNDFRRYLAPLHYRLDLKIPRMLYGNGHVKMTSKKP
jgi:ubiquinone/menaquinone biosynthesis C-methylase UbiE